MSSPKAACTAIQAASTEEQVISIVRGYLSSLSAEEVAFLPSGLTALGITHAEEVVQSALQLVHHEMLSVFKAPEAALLKDAAMVFSTAATRLASLAAQERKS